MGARLFPLVVLLVVSFANAWTAELPATAAADNRERLWSDLAGADAGKAYQAIWTLTKTPSETTAFIGSRLSPASAPDRQMVQQLIEDLSSPRFAVREKATGELTRLGGLVEPALHHVLSSKPSLETTQRIDKLLLRLKAPLTLPDHLRAVRAVETLEYLGADQAQKLLANYAGGAAGARLTEEAKQALQRLTKTEATPASVLPTRKDLYGDPLPAGALGRLGTLRFRRADTGLHGFALLPDGKSLLTAGSSEIQVWEIPSGRLRRSLDLAPLTIGGFALTPDRKTIAMALHSLGRNDVPGEIRILAFPSGNLVKRFVRENEYSANLAISANGKLLFSLSQRNREAILRIEEIASGKELLQKNFGRVESPSALAQSGDAKYLAVANERQLFLWRWQGEEPRKLPMYPSRYGGESIRHIAFSPDGRLLAATTAMEENLVVWDVPSGRLRNRQTSSSKSGRFVGQPVFTPDGKTLAMPLLSNEGVYNGIELLDPASGRSLGILNGACHSVAISADSWLLAGATDVGVRFWDLRSRKEMWANDSDPASAPYEIVTAGKLLVTANHDYTVRVWDSISFKEVRRYITKFGTGIALSPDQKLLAASSHDDVVHVWDLRTGREKYRLAGHGRLGGRYTVGFQADGEALLSFGDDLYLRVWDMKTGKARQEHAIRPKGIPIPELSEDDDASAVPRAAFGREMAMMMLGGRAFSPDGKKFLLGTRDGLRAFDTETGKETPIASSRAYAADVLAISPDSKLVLARSYRNRPIGEPPSSLVDMSSGKTLQSFHESASYPCPMAFAADGRMFALASTTPKDEITLYEAASGKVRARIQGFPGHVTSLAFLSDGRRLASGLSDSSVILWDLTSSDHYHKDR